MAQYLISIDNCPVAVKAVYTRISSFMFNNNYDDVVKNIHIMQHSDYSGDICKMYGLGCISRMIPTVYVLHRKDTGAPVAAIANTHFNSDEIPSGIEESVLKVYSSDSSISAIIKYDNPKITYTVTKYLADELILPVRKRDPEATVIQDDLFGNDLLTLFNKTMLAKHHEESREDFDFEEKD